MRNNDRGKSGSAAARAFAVASLCASALGFSPARAQFTYPGCPDLQAGDFRKVSLVDKTSYPDLDEPIKMDVAHDGRVFWIERAGAVRRWDPATGKVALLASLNVYVQSTRGGTGIVLDPDFDHNNWLYLGYTPMGAPADHHQISRFTLAGDKLLDEKPLLRVPLLANTGNHATAAMAFDPKGNLFITMGDAISPINIGAFAVDGYAPIHPGNPNLDARRTAANSNDLNGKILRIHPEAAGGYTVPVGNLFPEGTAGTRPEIYSMGHRNPFTLWYDRPTGWLFVGEVGPDALQADPERGPAAQDEFNVVKGPGNYGWPFMGGQNIPYNEYDYVNKKTGPKFDPNNLQNNSPYNTGLKNLPPARPALIAFGHDGKSPDQSRFPLLGGPRGGAPIGGPLYRYQAALDSKAKLPPHFDGAWFLADHERQWFLAAMLDSAAEKVESIRNPFPGIAVHGVIGMTVGPEGALYLIEYGEIGYSSNNNQRISRIEYQGSCLPKAATGLSRPFGHTGPRPPAMRPRLTADLSRGRVLVYGAGQATGPAHDLFGRAIPAVRRFPTIP